AIAMLAFGFAFISLSSQGAASGVACDCPLSSRQDLFAAIAVHDLLDDLDAEPWPGRRIHPAVDMRERAGDEIMLHGISERLELEQLAGGRIERDREARGRHDRRRPGVGVGLPAVELAAFGHLLEAGNALRAPRIDADHIDGPSRQHPLELLERPLALAISDACRRLGAEVGVAFRIPGPERLLDPGEIVVLHRLGPTHGVGYVPFDRDAIV